MKENPRKQQIVDAASRAIAQKGYADASIKDIAAEAGLPAPGLIHYYFKTKEDILREVVRRSRRLYEAHFGAMFAEGTSDPSGETETVAPDRSEPEKHEPEWYKLRYELFAQGLRNPELSGDVAELLRIGREGISNVLGGTLDGLDDEENEALSAVLLACFDGLALQKLLQPELDLERAYALLESLIIGQFPASE
ncbi:TetR family transcriptional regulator [Saccharibacillus sp. O23]|uniref:TetR/AcrR family transcriptional regulator n=1 Tax=Saccharibacillus sp. O23 TaxID=2009338 RepID=UPI000B4E1022|nr:TetR/AcrR family transcriptional regulator [Saccharibacillus sp. O23]OWR31785.1 TetR family transcriptional regulator [Saccharibacillus sp. O23]